MADVFFQGRQWIARWYRADGSRKKQGLGRGIPESARREAERAAAELEAKDRKETTESGRAFESILSRVIADAKAGKLHPDRAAEYLTEIRRVSDPSFHLPSLTDHLTAWRAGHKSQVEESTATIYGDAQKAWEKSLGPGVMKAPISDLTRQHIEAGMRKMKKGGAKSATVNLYLRMLRQALKQPFEDEIIPRNVAAQVKALPETDSTERAPFTAAEVRRMIDHEGTPEEWKGCILIAAHTGLRLGDVVNLKSSHVEGTEIVIRPAKTGRSKKMIRIPLTPPALAWIAGKKGAFFPKLSSLKTATLSMKFKTIMKRAGVPDKVMVPGGIEASRSFHSLRHSFASWLAEADIHADVRQKLTGHSSAGVHGRYTHHDDALKRAIETLPDLSAI